MNKIRLLSGDCFEVLKTLGDNSIDSIVTDPPYGLSFMGKRWDYDVPSVVVWCECLRVLKHGGHLLSFAGARTYHRMAVNIEDAGFEIRDQIMWVYGSGFPKSHNIGKAVDKLQGNDRKIIQNPKVKQQTESKDGVYGDYEANTHISIGNTEHEGWGTALKPAHEPIVMARKPLSEKTIAKNVLRWGTGGVNVDGCRVATDELKNKVYRNKGDNLSFGGTYGKGEVKGNPQGRFPANFIHDGSDEVVGLFPQSMDGTAINRNRGKRKESTVNYANHDGRDFGYGGGGSAARFFYCPKANKKERNAGCEDMEGEVRFASTNESGKMLPSKLNEPHKVKGNYHPTVKPLALMQYLCRLVTPTSGVVLDPFMGSGTTGIAAKAEGFGFVGIEREAEYIEIAKARIHE